jgi:hypothetical protein
MEAWRKEMTVCVEKMEAFLGRKEPAPVEMVNVAAHLEDCNGTMHEEKGRLATDLGTGI